VGFAAAFVAIAGLGDSDPAGDELFLELRVAGEQPGNRT